MKRSRVAVVTVLLLASVSFFFLAPVYSVPIGAPTAFQGRTVLPRAGVSASYYYLGFGVVSVNLCGHQRLSFEVDRGLNFSC